MYDQPHIRVPLVQVNVNLFTDGGVAGPSGLLRLAQGLERLGFDEIDLGEHVTVGRPLPGRPMPDPPAMSMLEPLVTLAALATVTQRIHLGTGVLVLPQRQPALVAKQVATLDILSGGRVRLGVGVGWQKSEFDSLGVPFAERGDRMDEAIRLLRLYWTQSSVTFHGRFFHADAMSSDPPPLQRGGPPIWLGGGSDAALRRVGRLGDGWCAVGESPVTIRSKVEVIRRSAERAQRDPSAIGLQILLLDLSKPDDLAKQATAFRAAGFGQVSLAIPDELFGARSVDDQLQELARIKELIDRGTAGD